MRRVVSKLISSMFGAVIVVSLLSGVGPLFVGQASAAILDHRTLLLSDSRPGSASRYTVSFDTVTADTLGSVKIEFCSNTALFEVSCIAPVGFDISTATLSSQSGEVGFSIDPSTTSNKMVLTRPPSAAAPAVLSYSFDNVQNASATGSQFARFSTFATDDASGTETDLGAVAYALVPSFSLSAEVPPYLTVCLGVTISGTNCQTAQGNYLNMGTYSPNLVASDKTQVVVATNASNGYILAISGNSMTSGNNTIPALSTPTNSVPGRSQFGINVVSNTNPVDGENPSGPGSGQPTANYNQSNRFMYQSDDVIAASNGTEDYRKYTVTYMVNIDRAQKPGVYSSTFTFTGLGNF